MGEQKIIKSFLQSFVYGLKSVSEFSSFIVFLLIFLILFVFGFFLIFKTLGLGAFLTGGLVYTPSTFNVLIGEAIFIISFFLAIFSLGALFYYKLYFLFSNNLNFFSFLKRSLVIFPKFLIATFVQTVVAILGLIVFILPGVYYGSSLMFSNFFSIYGNSTLRSAFANSKILAKNLRFESLLTFVVYLILLFIFIYFVNLSHLPEVYAALAYSVLLSYWVISYSNTIFNLADKNLNELNNKSMLYRTMKGSFNSDN
ncbi:MAG: hypothetical protein BJBARM4_0694 [Candidatus Parvarchaeum acidiphilum ARMAN-4]|jgi:hypothetical protein|uniref:Uncharacterized protein n=1 Tax=Candidatus Parvarchaeum acidiphilum ARMAN-4 TaxID=662760 RepID=D2EG11_PARA4|nr:MAG: hypothetical protein BJBARM4_0694 [Candidatus Parvarchaeum acidiphilum ARMAN-4]